MKRIVKIGSWEVEVDVERTASVYEETKRGSPADCGCNECRNVQSLGDAAYPIQFLKLLMNLGIDFRKAAEIHDWGSEVVDGHKEYGGWFHCIGDILSGPLDATASTRADEWPWHKLEEGFKVVIDKRRDLAFKEFGDAPLVRLEFFARLPWVLKS